MLLDQLIFPFFFVEFHDLLFQQEIGGRKIKVNVTEKPLEPVDLPLLQAEESGFVDSPYKVYVGNLAKTVTTEVLNNFFSEKGKVLGAKVPYWKHWIFQFFRLS